MSTGNEPTYTLITVTHCGAVHVQEGIKSLQMAEEARHIALYGRSIEQQALHDKWLREEYFADPANGTAYFEDAQGTCKFARIFPVSPTTPPSKAPRTQ